MLFIALLENEIIHQRLFLDALHTFEKNYSDTFDVTLFNTSEEILKSNLEFDIIFIDIGLENNKDGIEVGKKLREIGCKSPFIIISSYTNRHKDAINIGILRYIEKPFKQAEFDEALFNAVKYLQTQRYTVPITINGQSKFIRIPEIVYIENYQKKRIIHLKNGLSQETTSTWEELEKALPSHMFCFVQHSFLINLHYLAETTSNTITLVTGDIIKISRNKKDEFKKAYARYVEMQIWESHYLLY